MATAKSYINGRTDAQLRRLWRRWTGVIQGVVMPRRRSLAVRSRDYRQLHQELMRVLADAVESIETKDSVFCRLQELAKPWVTLECVEHAEKQVLRNLLVRCHQEEIHWCGQTLGGGRAFAVKAIAIAGMAAVLTFGYLSLYEGSAKSGGGDLMLRVQETFASLRFRLTHATFFEKYVVVASVAVLVCIRVLVFRGR